MTTVGPRNCNAHCTAEAGPGVQKLLHHHHHSPTLRPTKVVCPLLCGAVCLQACVLWVPLTGQAWVPCLCDFCKGSWEKFSGFCLGEVENSLNIAESFTCWAARTRTVPIMRISPGTSRWRCPTGSWHPSLELRSQVLLRVGDLRGTCLRKRSHERGVEGLWAVRGRSQHRPWETATFNGW